MKFISIITMSAYILILCFMILIFINITVIRNYFLNRIAYFWTIIFLTCFAKARLFGYSDFWIQGSVLYLYFNRVSTRRSGYLSCISWIGEKKATDFIVISIIHHKSRTIAIPKIRDVSCYYIDFSARIGRIRSCDCTCCINILF